MDKIIKKAINDLVWFIPFKRFRNSIRVLLHYFFNKLDKLDKLDKLGILDKIDYIIAEYDNSGFDDCVIIQCDGGFADQINTFITGKYIELNYNKKVKYDLEWYDYNGLDWNKKFRRNFELLNIFPDIDFNLASKEEIYRYKSLYHMDNIEIDYKSLYIISNLKKLHLFSRYKEIYFYNSYKDLFDEILDFDKYLYPKLDNNNLEVYNSIKSSDCPIAIHIRLGDLEDWGKEILSTDYLKKSVKFITEKIKPSTPKFFIFSNDINYVKEMIWKDELCKYQYEFVVNNDNDKGYIDFYLISKCKHVIGSVGRFALTSYNFIKYDHKTLLLPNNINKDIIEDFRNTNFYDIEENENLFIISYNKNIKN